MRTAMRADAMPGEDPQTVPLPETVAPKVVELCLPGELRHGVVVG